MIGKILSNSVVVQPIENITLCSIHNPTSKKLSEILANFRFPIFEGYGDSRGLV